MCDVEEPPAKISKTEMSSRDGIVEESQEEWLSEDMLTDDDNHEVDPDKTDSNLDTSQEELDETFLDEEMLSAEHSMDSQDTTQTSQADITQEQDITQQEDVTQEQDVTQEEDVTQKQDVTQEQDTTQEDIKSKEQPSESIEQTLNDFENQSPGTSDKQADSQQAGKSDGNDTDDLLRLLGDNDDKSKKKVLVKTKEKNGMSRGLKEKSQRDDESGSSDDEYLFKNATVQKLRIAKNALARKPAARAEPEDFDEGDDETDCSSSEEASTTMQSIFAMNKPKVVDKNTMKPSPTNQRPPVKKVLKIGETIIEPAKKITRLANKSQPSKPAVNTIAQSVNNTIARSVNNTITRSVNNTITRSVNNTITRSANNNIARSVNNTIARSVNNTIARSVNNGPISTVSRNGSRTASKERTETKPPPSSEHDEIINAQEFMEDDDFDLDEDFAENSDTEASRNTQQIMKPEQMDEELPTDTDSECDSDVIDHLDDIYDDVPSPESEDRDDWFALDIRAERASEYLPLLGDKARDLLTAERRRVSSRLATLRAQLSQLHCSGQQQARLLRRAALVQAELDDMIKAA